MNLIIDIGNTQTKLVAFKNGEPASEVITCDNTLSALPAFLAQYACEQGIVSTVITLSPEAEAQLHALPFTVLRFTSTTPVPIRVAYRTPQTLGVDRIAAVVGAVTIKANRNLLVIDVGTCITYELVDAAGVYQGGNISPGIKIRLNALHQYTGLLPLVSEIGETPDVGFDTSTAIRSGVINGITNEMEGYIAAFSRKYQHLFVFLTGGDSLRFATRTKSAIFADKFLVPRGLNRILEYNDKE